MVSMMDSIQFVLISIISLIFHCGHKWLFRCIPPSKRNLLSFKLLREPFLSFISMAEAKVILCAFLRFLLTRNGTIILKQLLGMLLGKLFHCAMQDRFSQDNLFCTFARQLFVRASNIAYYIQSVLFTWTATKLCTNFLLSVFPKSAAGPIDGFTTFNNWFVRLDQQLYQLCSSLAQRSKSKGGVDRWKVLLEVLKWTLTQSRASGNGLSCTNIVMGTKQVF